MFWLVLDKTTLEIVNQKLEKLVKKEPITSLTSRDSRLNTLEIHTTSNGSSNTSSESENEIEQLENQFQDLQVNKLHRHRVIPTSLTKSWYRKPTPPDLQFKEKNVSN